MYDPSIGRWFTEDPIEFEGGDADLYRYVGNDPTNAIDPSGLALEVAGKAVKDNDDTFKKVLEVVTKIPGIKDEGRAAIEILTSMIKSPIEKKTYAFKTLDDLTNEVKLRLYIVFSARQLADNFKGERLGFSYNRRIAAQFTDSDGLFNPIQVKIGDKEPIGLVLAKKTPAEGVRAILLYPKADKNGKNRPICDCATTVNLAILNSLRLYLGADDFNNLYKGKKFILDSVYGLDRFLKLPKEGEKTDLLPGDTAVFTNEGAKDPTFLNENTIYLGENEKFERVFFAPGLGILTEGALRAKLNALSEAKMAKIMPASGKIIVP